MEIILNNKDKSMELWKEQLQNKNLVPLLQNRIDEAEKNKLPRFQGFSDTDMLFWYLHQQKNINIKKDRSERTIKEYERELILFVEQLLEYGKEIDVDVTYIIEGSLFKSLNSRHLRRYQEWLVNSSPFVLSKGPYSPATIERKNTIIKSFFAFLYKVGYIAEPIHDGFLIATVRKDERPDRDLGPKEVIYLLNTFRELQHPIMFAIVHVLSTTGIRNEEFCNLKIGDYRIDTILGGSYLNVLGKGNKLRQVPLKEKVVKSINMFRHARGLPSIEKANPNDPLFTTNTGKAYSPSYLSQYVSKEINKLYLKQDKQPVKLTPHYFRHAFAIISRINKVDVYDIMRSLGHERLETTEIYLEKVFAKENHAIHSWKPEFFGEYI